MMNDVDVRHYIDSCNESFYNYLCNIVLDDETFKILLRLTNDSKVYIFSGIIRDFLLGNNRPVRDIDIVFQDSIKLSRSYKKYLKKTSFHENSFRGLKISNKDGLNIDIWQLNKTWGIINKQIEQPNIESLLSSVFFNFSSIVYDLNNKRFIYNESFVEFLETNTLDLVYEQNPSISLCLLNVFHYTISLKCNISYKLRCWIKKHFTADIDFEDTQNRHFGTIVYDKTDIIKFLKSISNMKYGINWKDYLSTEREKQPSKQYDAANVDKRSAFESDFGRVVFSSAMRRMHDKTQVIPLTSGDNIHTRLTHSIEVMNIAQSLVVNLCRDKDFISEYGESQAHELENEISSITKTAAFVHDIGNPPFGHFGETIIQNYFKKYLNNHILQQDKKLDYEYFDGNAQGFRILTHLSYFGYLSGLNLTYATLGAYLKYPNINIPNKEYIGTKKHGIFITESEVFKNIVEKCHLRCENGRIKRHPLSFLVEAADSISYNVMDIEDGYQLHWYDSSEMISFLDEEITRQITDNNYSYPGYKNDKGEYSFLDIVCKETNSSKPDPCQQNRNQWIVNFRVVLIQYLIELANRNFKEHISEIDKGKYSKELIEDDNFLVAKTLQKFTQRYIFPRLEIQRAELTGYSVINGLLDILLNYVSSKDVEFRKRVKNIISKSALRVAIHESNYSNDQYHKFGADELFKFDVDNLSENAKLRLVVDFVSGMTDKFAVSLYQELSGQKISY